MSDGQSAWLMVSDLLLVHVCANVMECAARSQLVVFLGDKMVLEQICKM